MLEVRLRRTDGLPSGQSEAAWTLLREMLAGHEYAGLPESLPEIRKNRRGKPYFEGNPVFFNLSHTKGAVAAAISDREIGIDIQAVRPISPKVAARFLHVRAGCSDPALLTRMWAEYESYAKFLGCGIPITLPDRPHAVRSFDLGGLMLAVCAPDPFDCMPVWAD